MIIAMFFGMSRSLGLRPTPWDLIANALLLIQFSVAHSFLLTSKGRSVLSHLAPQRIGSRLATTYAAINQPGDPGGDDRHNEIPREFLLNKFKKLGLIDYNGSEGGIEVHSSLLNLVLHEQPEIKTNPVPPQDRT